MEDQARGAPETDSNDSMAAAADAALEVARIALGMPAAADVPAMVLLVDDQAIVAEAVRQALAAGAAGVQAGTVFALAEESGMKPVYRTALFDELKRGKDDAALVRTTLFSPTGFPFKVAQLGGTLAEDSVYAARRRVCDLGYLLQCGLSKPDEDGARRLFQRCPAAPVDSFTRKRGLPFNTQDKRCLCNGLLACVGLGQVIQHNGEWVEEPAIVTLGNHLDGVRRLSRHGQFPYWARDAVNDILDR